jgi:putative SOS response-associated peptidase YedK
MYASNSVILPPATSRRLARGNGGGNLKDLLVPYPADQMRMWEISPRPKQRGRMMIHRSANPFMQSQRRRQPMRSHSCLSRQTLEGHRPGPARLSQANRMNWSHTSIPVCRRFFLKQHHAAWLAATEDGNLKELLVPYPADQMRMWEISPRANSAGE